MGWFSGFFGGSSGDSSAMKVSNSGDTIKTERISSRDGPHTHDIVKVDKPSGTVKMISVGENVPRKSNK